MHLNQEKNILMARFHIISSYEV